MKTLVSDISERVKSIEEKQKELLETDEGWGAEVSGIIASNVGQFIRVHPFLDGNGRTSRLLWIWFLERFEIPLKVEVIRRPAAPYQEIMTTSMMGDDGPLLDYILRQLEEILDADEIASGGSQGSVGTKLAFPKA